MFIVFLLGLRFLCLTPPFPTGGGQPHPRPGPSRISSHFFLFQASCCVLNLVTNVHGRLACLLVKRCASQPPTCHDICSPFRSGQITTHWIQAGSFCKPHVLRRNVTLKWKPNPAPTLPSHAVLPRPAPVRICGMVRHTAKRIPTSAVTAPNLR